ncbi:MAG: glutamine--fructose-6-phosphate transaminase (isomerizing), partial [Flavobacteriales bacterium]|nr:glutamine--fructose-6-phosphate transaminase (isomerizing) [Flavobacteriales bacterium]
MCGIVAYVGNKEAYPILIKGLKRLEYRGYDSAGVCLLNSGLHIYKCKGKVSDLEDFAKEKDRSGSIGIGHTRWATHGEPNDVNAHPHYSGNEILAMIHNGIIENYDVLKEELLQRGHEFRSDTDTEVLIHLIEDIQANEKLGLAEAVRVALTQVIGAYAIAVMDKNDPDVLIGAKKGSPMVVGIGNDEFFLASDATPIVEFTKDVVYLDDDQIVELRRGKEISIRTIENEVHTPYIQELEMHLETLEKGGYEHFMLKEIHEQSSAVANTLNQRTAEGKVLENAFGTEAHKVFDQVQAVHIVACGTSYHAGLIARYWIEDICRIPCNVEIASEYRYRNPVVVENT